MTDLRLQGPNELNCYTANFLFTATWDVQQDLQASVREPYLAVRVYLDVQSGRGQGHYGYQEIQGDEERQSVLEVRWRGTRDSASG